MLKTKHLAIILCLLLPYLLAYRSFFSTNTLVWGDAPFFYQENLKELFSQPLLWNFRNDNFGFPQLHVLWLYLPTFLYGLLNHFLGLNNTILIRLVFYFPATILAIVGSWLFVGQFTKNLNAKLLGSLLYGFNTYFLMVLDGGQVGVAVSFGLFPVALFTLLKFWENTSAQNFLISFLVLAGISNIDLRIFLLVIFTAVFWNILKALTAKTQLFTIRTILALVLLMIAVGAVDAFWLLPLINNQSLDQIGLSYSSNSSFISLLDSLLIFQPHFPNNEFGKILPPPFYFVFIPVLVFAGLLLNKFNSDSGKAKTVLTFSALYLFFAFLAKGGGEPLGTVYLWLVDHIPGGVAFRDSSKFYIPLLLFGSCLLALTVQALEKWIKNEKIRILTVVAIYIYLLLLIYPAVLGNLSGTLGNKTFNNDYIEIYQKLKSEQSFLRTLWFDERPQMAFADWQRPALSANLLYQERPFASLNIGKHDLFNYIRAPEISSWFKLLGIKYLFFPENERKKTWNLEEKEDREKLLLSVASISSLTQLDWPLSFSAYRVDNTKPHLFAQSKVVLVVGGEQIYQHLDKEGDFLAGQGFIFLEDGKVNPNNLKLINANDAILVFENKDLTDLIMVYLQDKMIPPTQAIINQWQLRSSNDYLNWKYDLLKQAVASFEFDFGQGVVFSTVPNEKIKFNLSAPTLGNYYLAVRFTNASSSASLQLKILDQEKILFNPDAPNFKWDIVGPFTVSSQQVLLEITNSGQFGMLNTLALIPEKEFISAQQQAMELMSQLKIIPINKEEDWSILTSSLKTQVLPVAFEQINPTQYQITNISPAAKWLVFSDHYHPFWQIQDRNKTSANKTSANKTSAWPFYSMINGFYLGENLPDSEVMLVFVPQQNIWKGILISLISFVVVVCTTTVISLKKRHKNG